MTTPSINTLPDLARNPTRPGAAVDMDEEQFQAQKADARRRVLQATYMNTCPLAKDNPAEGDFVVWVQALWTSQNAAMVQVISWSQRNRLFRQGMQWLSNYRGVWREPPMPRDVVRVTDNKIRPGLDWALQVMAEQRPGFKFQPNNADPQKRQKAESKQQAVEFQFHSQNMRDVMTEAGYYAQTDGVSFMYTYWNPEKGQWDDLGDGPQPLGDNDTCVFKIEEVRVSPNATKNIRPLWWVIRRTMSSSAAAALYGEKVLNQTGPSTSVVGSGFGVYANSDPEQRSLIGNDTIDCYMLFLESTEYVPGGLTLTVVGNAVVRPPEPLPTGTVTIQPFRDGSSDPAFFPEPKMNGLIAPQMRVNMLKSKAYENVRNNAGGRLLGKTGSLVTETFAGTAGLQLMEIQASGDIRDSVMPLQGFSIGDDVKELLQNEYKCIEDEDGWNDAARGQFADDASGRAILAVREQLERTFAPFVFDAATAMSGWSKHQVLFMRWGYQMPRVLAVMGTNRPDLAREFSESDFDGVADCWVDPQTMMPMPESMKQFLLDGAFEKGIITVREYRKRHRFSFSDNLHTPDEIQEAKGMRVVEQLRTGQAPEPIVWQDDEAIQQDILQDELILVANVTPDVRMAAQMRWDELAMQAQAKAGMMAPPMGGEMGGEAPPASGPAPVGTDLPPPLTDQDNAARQFELSAAQ